MKKLLFYCLFLSTAAHANFLFNYNLNYSTQSEAGSITSSNSRTFHKGYLAGSTNRSETFFIGWNINSWSLNRDLSGVEAKYSTLEMGPRFTWFTSQNYNLYFTFEWNPYVKGSRDAAGANVDLSGSSLGFGVG